MKPMQILILIHYELHYEDHLDNSLPAVRDYIKGFLESGFLKAYVEGSSRYKLTDKGKLYISTLLSVPEPVQEWIIPNLQDDTK